MICLVYQAVALCSSFFISKVYFNEFIYIDAYELVIERDHNKIPRKWQDIMDFSKIHGQ